VIAETGGVGSTGAPLTRGAKKEAMTTPVAPVALYVRNQTRGTVLCLRAKLARGFRERRRGLLWRTQLNREEGMLFEAARFLPLMWMHTFFMAFPIDIIFLGHGDVVMKIQASLKPWRLSALVLGARKAIELCEGAAVRSNTAVGDLISLREI
jgi:uncharacterized membrane protein (UPF0127 family)